MDGTWQKIEITPPDMDLIDDADLDKRGINKGFLVQKDGMCIVAEDLNM